MFQEREWMVVLVLWVWPAVGLGQWNATIDLTSGGAHVVDVAPGGSFALTVGLDSNQPVGCIQFRLTVNDGADDHLFEGQFDSIDPFAFGSLFGPPFPSDANLFAREDFISQMAAGPVSLAGLPPEFICPLFGEAGANDMSIFPGTLVSYTLTAPNDLGDYIFGVADAVLTNSQGNIGIDSGLQFNTLTVHTPEPASGLLLLAVLPFLWCRRR